MQLFVIFRRQRRTSAKCNFYYSNNRSVLVPSTCMFYAIVWGKDETKILTARIVVGSFQSALQMHGSYNVTVVQSPTSLPSPSQKKYRLLLKVKLLSLMSFTCCHISVTGSALSNVRPFRANYPIHSVRENDKLMNTMGQFSRTDSLLFKDRSFSCTLDLVMQIQPV